MSECEESIASMKELVIGVLNSLLLSIGGKGLLFHGGGGFSDLFH